MGVNDISHVYNTTVICGFSRYIDGISGLNFSTISILLKRYTLLLRQRTIRKCCIYFIKQLHEFRIVC